MTFDALTKVFDLVLFPFRQMAPVWGVAFLALLTAIFILMVYKWVSNQRAIARLKKQVQGHFLGIYLFRDDPVQVLRSLGNVCACSVRYVGCSLIPLAVVLVPIALACVQMQLRYGYEAPRTGESLIVSLKTSNGMMAGGATLTASPGLRVETPPLLIPASDEVDWRVRVEGHGEQHLEFGIGGLTLEKEIVIDSRVRGRYPVTAQESFINSLINPGEQPLPADSPVYSVSVGYRSARVNLFGIKMHWSIAYFLMAVVFGMLLKRFMGVEF